MNDHASSPNAPGASAGGPAVSEEIARIEAAITTLVRRTKLPNAHARITQTAGVDVDRAGYIVLNRIGEWEPLRMSELAERLNVDLSTVSRHVTRLQRDGYVDRTTDPSDRRASLLRLSDTGRDAVCRVRDARRAHVAALLEEWPASDRTTLAALLDRLVDTIMAAADRAHEAEVSG